MLNEVQETEESKLLQEMIIKDVQRELLLEGPTPDERKEWKKRHEQLLRKEYLDHVYRTTYYLASRKDIEPAKGTESIAKVIRLEDILRNLLANLVEIGKQTGKVSRPFEGIEYNEFKAVTMSVADNLIDAMLAAKRNSDRAKAVKKELAILASYCHREERRLDKPSYHLIDAAITRMFDAFRRLRQQAKEARKNP